MRCPLRKLQSLAAERSRWLDVLSRGGHEDRNVAVKMDGAAFDQIAGIGRLPPTRSLDGCVTQHRGRRPARQGQCLGDVATRGLQRSEVGERGADNRMSLAEDSFSNRKRPFMI